MAGEGWFGGGADLTPYYLDDGDVEEFHRFYKDICDRYDSKVSSVVAEGLLLRVLAFVFSLFWLARYSSSASPKSIVFWCMR